MKKIIERRISVAKGGFAQSKVWFML